MSRFAKITHLSEEANSEGTYDVGEEVFLNTSNVISVCRHGSQKYGSDIYIVCMAGVDDGDNGWIYVDEQSAANITGCKL